MSGKKDNSKDIQDELYVELLELRQALQKNQSAMQQSQTAFKRAENKVKRLEASVADFDKSSKEVDKIVDAYSKASKDLEDRKKKIEGYYDHKWPMVDASMEDSEKKEKISTEVKSVHKKMFEWRKKIEKLEGATEEAEGAEKDDDGSIMYAEIGHQKADRKREKAEKHYTKLKDFQKRIDTKLKELETYENLIEEEEAKGGSFKKENMYTLTFDLGIYLEKQLKDEDFAKELAKEIKLKEDMARFKQELSDALEEVTRAKGKLGAAETTLNERKEDNDNTKKLLEEAEKNYKKEILEKIHLALSKQEPPKTTKTPPEPNLGNKRESPE